MAEASSGLLDSIKRLLSTLTTVAATRLELLANELHEARLHLEQILLYSILALFCFCMMIMLLTVFIVVLFWDDHRLLVLGGLGAVFFVLAVSLMAHVQRIVKAKPKLFSASLAEFSKDKTQLDEKND
ncbi:MAG: phage holin family protein [Gallionella sp.]